MSTYWQHPAEALLHDVVERQVRRSPLHPAVEWYSANQSEAKRLTYAELNDQANELALTIRTSVPASAREVVAICLPKSPRLFVSILATLKLGWTWTPIDPTAPKDHRLRLLHAIGSCVLLTSDELLDLPLPPSVLHVVSTDRILPSATAPPACTFAELQECTSNTACHILWTSGSTGTPKGVIIPHLAVVNNVAALSRMVRLGEHTRTFQFANFTFDVFALDLFMTWGSGGCLVAGEQSQILQDPSAFMSTHGITFAHLTPSVIQMLDPVRSGHALEALASSGEAMTDQIIHRWASRTRLFNLYGPTETDVVTAHRVTKDSLHSNIGLATDGMTVRILDDFGAEVANGEAGEICVNGPQLMVGYLNAEKSSKDWHGLASGELFYRTGDFGICDDTGNFQILGRRDHQVKVRGNRVNLAMIESILQRESIIDHAVCVFPKAGLFCGHICVLLQAEAFASSERKESFKPDDSSQAVAAVSHAYDRLLNALPSALVPTRWWSGTLPLTRSNKIDRRVLSAWLERDGEDALKHQIMPNSLHDATGNDCSMAMGELSILEQTVRATWASLLQVDASRLSSDLSFYAAGGHSVLAIRLIAALHAQGIALALSDLRNIDTIRKQVRFAEQCVHSVESNSTPDLDQPLALLEDPDSSLLSRCAEACSIPEDHISNILPCTATQEGLLASSLQKPGRYVCHLRFSLLQSRSGSALGTAWSRLVASESILRTRIVHLKSVGMVQVMLTTEASGSLALLQHSVDGQSLLGSALWSSHYATSDRAGSVLDVHIHHALMDGWQSELLIRKFNSSLASIGDEDPSAVRSTPFAHFVQYTRDQARSASSAQFWSASLAESVQPDFPSKPSTADASTSDSTCLRETIPFDYRDVATQCAVPPGIVLGALWTLAYSELAGGSNVTFGTILSGRDAPVTGIETVFGPTLTIVPFFTPVEHASTFEQFVHLHDDTHANLRPHQHFGLQNIRGLSAECYAACNFHTLFLIQPEADPSWPGDTAVLTAKTEPTYEYPLVVTFVMQPNAHFAVEAQYWPNVLRAEEVRCLLDQITVVARRIAHGGTTQTLEQLTIASVQAVQRMTQQCKPPVAQDMMIHEMFSQAVARSPLAVAIYDQASNASLTYQTIDACSASLAEELRIRGARDEEIVPICMEKSSGAIAAMLGILRAGCAYVPIDITHPFDRREALIKRVGARFVVCAAHDRNEYCRVVGDVVVVDDYISDTQTNMVVGRKNGDAPFPESVTGSPDSSLGSPAVQLRTSDSIAVAGTSADQVLLDSRLFASCVLDDESSSGSHTQSQDTQDAKQKSDNIALVLYTSGSTGQPKGVILTHRNIATAIHCLAKSFDLGPGIRTLQFSAFTFDMSLMEIWMAWYRSGCVCVPSPHARIHNVSENLRTMHIDTVVATSTVASLLRLEDAPFLKTMIISGERLTKMIADKFSSAVRLYQCYGPTESGISVTSTRVPAGSSDLANIGSPISARVWILDDKHRVVPPGHQGEIAISGPTVAKGYLNADELTESRFVNLKFGAMAPPEKVYLTGDIGRLDCNGTIRIQGRKDFQVKIRGIRVELGEIEDNICSADPDNLSEAVVVYTKQRLVAFVHIHTGGLASSAIPVSPALEPRVRQTILAKTVETHLRSILPRYMIPSRFIFLDNLPKTSSGKVDRRKLELTYHHEEISETQQRGDSIDADHSTTHENVGLIPHVLREILDVVLDLDDSAVVRLSDSFFDHGGDSFAAIRLAAAAREAGFHITVPQIFAKPKLHAVWEHMSTSGNRFSPSPRAPDVSPFALKDFVNANEIRESTGLEPHQIEDIYPCTSFQEGVAALATIQPRLYLARVVLKIVDADAERLRRALQLVIERTPVLRTAIVATSSYGTLQVVGKGEAVLVSQIMTSRTSLEILQSEDPHLTGPYLCNINLTIEDGICYVSIDQSHAIYDGWSQDLFLQDLSTAYSTGVLSPTDTSFKDFIAFHHLKRQAVEHQSFWRDYLDGSASSSWPDVPHDEVAIKADQEHTCRNAISWPKRFSKTHLLHAAWALALALYENSSDPCYGTVLSGRDADFLGIERVRGPTMAAAVCRLPVHREEKVATFLQRAESLLTEIGTHALYGLQNVRTIDEHTARACDFRTMLVVQPQARSSTMSSHDLPMEIIYDRMMHGYPVTMECEPSEDGLTSRLYFDHRWISADQAARFTRQTVSILRELCHGTESDVCIKDVNILPAEDLRQIQTWNDIELPCTDDNLYNLFRQSVLLAPNAPAMQMAVGQTLSYLELDNIVCSLATRFQSEGLGGGDRVLIHMSKSPQQIAAVLAVVLAGATFVPVDLEWPIERARKVAITATANWALVDSDSFFRSADMELGLRVVALEAKLVSQRPTKTGSSMICEAGSKDLAYILFTSGTTGEPKGICTPHSAACTAIVALVRECGLSQASRLLAFSSLTFDSSILEIFGALVAGGVICIANETERKFSLEETISSTRANWLGLTPGVANTISPRNVPGVKTLTLFGESIPRSLIGTWSPHVRMIFGYGPTETTIVTTACHNSQDPYCIGKAIGTTTTWVVDPHDHNRLALIGAVGELVCIGPSIAFGYLNDQVRSEKAFIQPPDWVNMQSRRYKAYRTGDLVRYYPDGSIRILGRADGQLKIRGRRIELSEIDAVITKTGIPTGVITEVVTNVDTQLLVCFITLPDSQCSVLDEADTSTVYLIPDRNSLIVELRKRLQDTLPDYMQPWAIFPVNKLPRSSSGKIDRRLLRTLAEQWGADIGNGPVEEDQRLITETWTASEKFLQGLWAGVLQMDKSRISRRGKTFDFVSREESRADKDTGNFARLGGDSLKLMQLVARIRAGGYTIDPVQLHHNNELAQMAAGLSTPSNSTVVDAHSAPYSSLERRLETNIRQKVAERCEISPDMIADVYPLTPTQMSLMAASLRHPGSYMNRIRIKIPETTSLVQLKSALSATVSHQHILRTVFIPELGESGVQAVLKENSQFCDSPDPFAERLSSSSPTLPRFVLDQQNGDYHLIILLHHAAMDATSLRIICADLQSALLGRELQPRPAFSSFVEHVEAFRTEGLWRSAWLSYLDRPLPSIYPSQGDLEVPEPPGNLKCTLKMPSLDGLPWSAADLLNVGLAILLRKTSNAKSVCYGLALSGRNEQIAGVELIPGPTFATIPVVHECHEDSSMKEMLERHQNDMRLIMPHQQAGLAAIASLSQCGRQATSFTTLLVIHPDAVQDQKEILGHVSVQSESGDAVYPLEIECRLSDNNAEVTVAYDGVSVGLVQSQWLLNHFAHIIENQLISENHSKLTMSQVHMLTDSDVKQIDRWNTTPVVPEETSLCNMFAHVVRKRSGDIALDSHDGIFTYSQLDRLSSALASRIVKEVSCTQRYIPLMFEKSAASIIAIMAIIKTGAAYVPLDPAHPESRLKVIRDDIDSEIVVCSDSMSGNCGIWDRKIVFNLDSSDNLPTVGDMDSAVEFPPPSSTAYVMFTSGSSGKPKGVVVSHRAASTSIRDQIKTFGFSPGHRILHFCSYTFDVSVMEIFAAFGAGAILIIPSEVERTTGLASFIQSKSVDVAILTATAVRSFLRPSCVGQLRQLILVGEPITANLIEEYHDRVQLINDYGPTETTIDSATNIHVTSTTRATNVGHSISSNLWIVELSDTKSLCPLGVPGQLLISGPTLADGYLNDPERTHGAFMESTALPWTSRMFAKPTRLYKTGDMAQYGPNGEIHILGRLDTQIKLRGLRIELRDIESAMESFSPDIQVGAALVTCTDNEEMLVGVIVEQDQAVGTRPSIIQQPSPLSLRVIRRMNDHLRQSLPAYMCPARLLAITRLPVNASGKLDRAALTRILTLVDLGTHSRYRVGESGDMPQAAVVITEAELEVREIWAKLLKVDENLIEPSSSFFSLGGDSLLAIKMSSLLLEKGKNLSVATIFRSQSLRDMSRAIQTNYEGSQSTVASPRTLQVTTFERNRSLMNEMSNACQILPQEIEQVYPCSPLQNNLFVASLLIPGAYLARIQYKLDPNIDLSRFFASWEAVSQGNPILRTRIVMRDADKDDTLQVVVRQSIPWRRLRSLDECQTPPAAVSGGPLAQWNMVEQDTNLERHFVLFCHHSLYDEATLQSIFANFREVYVNGFIDGPPRLHMGHYLGHLEKVDADETKKVWRDLLRQPVTRHYPPHNKGARKNLTDSVASDRVVGTGSCSDWKANLTPYIRAAWLIAIARNQSEGAVEDERVSFGTVLTGRSADISKLSRISGPIIGTVPVVGNVRPSESLDSFLDQVREQHLAVIGHEHVGIHNIRRFGESEASACDFRTMLVIQALEDHDGHGKADVPEIEGFTAVGTELRHPCALMVECSSSSKGITISASYDSSELNEQAVEIVLDQFHSVLTWLFQTSHGPHLRVSDALEALMTPSQKDLIIAWNQAPDCAQSLLHSRFCKIAKIHPTRQAVFAADRQMTYQQLDHESLALAQDLIHRGIQAGCTIPVCFEKSSYMVVTQLAILRAGGAYVPISPDHPQHRRDHIRRQCNAHLCLVSLSARTLFTDDQNVLVVHDGYLRDLALARSSQLEYPPSHIHPTPQSPAYILYTSGSTGNPKGVQVSHGAIALSVARHAERFGHNRPGGVRSLQFCNYTFDVSLMDIFATLSYGGCVCVPSEDDRLGDVSPFILTSQAELAMLTPTIANLLSPTHLPSLVTLVVGGEPMTSSVIEKWTNPENSPPRTLHNVYGPTEASVNVATCLLNSQSSPHIIGRPVLGSPLFIAEPNCVDRLAPIGCVGELIIAGPCLADGYVNQPESTTAAFVQTPSWLPSGWSDRVYRTGDLARYTSDGQIICLGRMDAQVKIHGVRIELGEIESVARGAPGVRNVAAAVSRRQDREQLALFYELESLEQDNQASLRAHMATSLPIAMRPSIYVAESIPLTSTGKIDRGALTARLDIIHGEYCSELDLPDPSGGQSIETEEEQDLQKTWARLLNRQLEDIRLSSNFFELGADSLDVIKLVAHLQRAGHKISYRDVYASASLERMAGLLGNAASQKDLPDYRAPDRFELLETVKMPHHKAVSSTAALLHVDVTQIVDIYPCSHMQTSLVAASMLAPNAYWLKLDVELTAGIDIARVTTAWRRMVERHAILRTVIITHAELGNIQVVLDSDPSRLLPRIQRENGALAQPLHELMPDASPGHRNSHFRLQMHHAIYDNWVYDILMADLESLCRNGSFARPSVPPNHFIRFQQHHEAVSTEYWKSRLSGASITPFATNANKANLRPDQLMTSSLERTITVRPLMSRKIGVGMATIVHCAYALVISGYEGNTDVCFPTIQSGRNIPLLNVDNIVGPTITSMFFRADCSGSTTVLDFLTTAQKDLVEASEYQCVPQEVVRRTLDVTGSLGMSCMLVVQPRSSVASNVARPGGCFEQSQVEMHQAGSVLLEANVDDSGVVTLRLQYAPEALDEQQARLFVGHVASAISRLTSCHPTTRLQDVSFISPLDSEIITRSHGSAVDMNDGLTVTHRLRQAAVCRPDTLAVEAHDGQLTYRELAQLAGKLASRIKLLGNTQKDSLGDATCTQAREYGTRVAACAERGIFAVVMQVATFMVRNTAMIPLDQHSPPERNGQILDDARADMVLCTLTTIHSVEASITSMPTANGKKRPSMLVVDWDLFKRTEASFDERDLSTQEDTAYILYTSGSTGMPKGVCMDHGPLAATIQALTDYKGVRRGARVLWSSPWVFDSHLSQIWEALTVGGTVCVPDETALHQDAELSLASWVINHAFFTPSMAAYIDFEGSGIPRHLRTLALGGEPISFDVQPLVRAGVQVVNEYGPSESAICITAHTIRAGDAPAHMIGLPLSSNACWTVAAHDASQLAPVGTVGELVVGGTLARGYLQRRELTAAAFIKAPHWAASICPQVYLTGDLVRQDTQGRFHYLGRKDSQVKINGVRIELAEIEQRLASIDPSITALVAAIARNFPDAGEDGASSENRSTTVLVAFLSGQALRDASTESEQREIVRAKADVLHTRLAELLPRTMLPRVWLPLVDPPRTQTGKIDRNSLPAVYNYHASRHSTSTLEDSFRTSSQTGEDASLDEREQAMQHLWSTVLRCDSSKIGPYSDFFDFGDSIQAIALVAAASRAGFSLTAMQVFKKPSLRAMSRLLPESQQDIVRGDRGDHGGNILDRDPELFSLLPSSLVLPATKLLLARSPPDVHVEDICPLTPLQTVSLLGNQKMHASYHAWFVIEVKGPLIADRLRLSCQETMSNHTLLRTVFFPFEDSWYQASMHGLPLDFICMQWSGSRESVPHLLQSASRPVGVSFECPTSFRLLRASDDRHLLAIGLSHAQYDGISLSAVLDEIVARYRTAQPHDSPKPGFNRLLRFSQSQASSSRAYWRRRLAGSMMTPIFTRNPSMQRKPQDLLDTVAWLAVPMSSLSLPTGTTFHSVLTLAWAVTLSAATGSKDVVFGNLVSGRNAPIQDIASLPGPCINTVPVRVQLEQETLHEALQETHAARVGAISHEQIGLRDIARHCTDWPAGTHFASIIQHQNLDLWEDSTSGGDSKLHPQFSRAGSVSYRGACDEVDLWITSIGVEDAMRIQILFSQHNIGRAKAEMLLHVLCENVATIASGKQQDQLQAQHEPRLQPLIEHSRLSLDGLRLPLPVVQPPPSDLRRTPTAYPPGASISYEGEKLSRIVRQALQLPASAALSPVDSLQDVGADSVSSALVVALAREQGMDVSLADLAACESLGELFELAQARARDGDGAEAQKAGPVLEWDGTDPMAFENQADVAVSA